MSDGLNTTVARVARAVIGAGMALVFAYGVFLYPDAPIKTCSSGYCGKYGRAHTAAEFDDFMRWEHALFVVWPAGVVALVLLKPASRR
jgi:hypothetical protein